jgi:biuret amidohydrolase
VARAGLVVLPIADGGVAHHYGWRVPLDIRGLVVPSQTALLLNEVQPSTVSGPSDLSVAAAKILPNLVRLVGAARAADVQVVHCVKVFRRDSLARNRNILLYRRRGLISNEPVVPDSRPVPGSIVAPEVGPDERDLVMTRLHGMGSVTDTGVVPVLRNIGVSTVVVVGVSLNIGVPNTVMDLVNHAFEVVVAQDAVAGTPEDYGAQMLEHTIKFLATVTTTGALMEAWGSPQDTVGR